MAEQKLYEINVDMVFYAMAEDEKQAQRVGYQSIKEEIDNLSIHDFCAIEVKDTIMVSHANTYPYNSDDDKTVLEILDDKKAKAIKQAEREEWDKKQLKLFE